jgi:hypothetical protein
LRTRSDGHGCARAGALSPSTAMHIRMLRQTAVITRSPNSCQEALNWCFLLWVGQVVAMVG